MPSNRVNIKIAANVAGLRGVDKLRRTIDGLGRIEAFKRLRQDMLQSRQAWQDATAKVAELARRMRSAGRSGARLNRQFNAAKQRAAELKAEYLRQAAALHKTRQAMAAAGTDTARLAAEEVRLRKAAAAVRQQLYRNSRISHARGLLDVRPVRDVKREINRLQAAYRRLQQSGELSAAELYRAQSRLKEKISALRAETNGWAQSIGRARSGLMALAAAGYGIGRGFGQYVQYTQKMAEVNTLLDVSRQRHAALSDQIVELSRRLPQTATQLAAAEYDIISAGVALDKSVGVLEQAAKAAIAGVTDTKTAVRAGLGVLNAYGMSVSELGRVYDILFATVKNGVTTFPELAASIGDVLPAARSAGVDLRQVAASLAVLTKAGIRTPQAVTALKGAIMALAAPAPEAKKRLEELGIAWQGLIPTLDAIAARQLSLEQIRRIVPDMEASKAVLALTQNLAGLHAVAGKMAAGAGSMQAAYDKMKDTPENRIKLFKNEIAAANKAVMQFVASGLLPVIGAFKTFTGALSRSDNFARGFAATMAAAAGGLVLWKAGLGDIALGLKGMAANMLAARTAAGSLQAQLVATGIAAKTALAGSAIFAACEVYRAARAFVQWRRAAAEAAGAMDRLRQNSARYLEKFSRFADVQLPGDVTGKTAEQIGELKKQLRGAMAYYTALQNKLWAQSQERNWLGRVTDQAREAQKQLREVGAKIARYRKALHKLEAQTAAPVPQPDPAGTPKPKTEAELARQRADRRRLEKQLAAELLAISGSRRDKALAAARQHYEQQVALAHGNKELLARIESNYAARVAKIRRQQAEAETRRQKAMAQARVRAATARMEATTATALERLQSLYKNGQVALEEYFARRRELIEARHKAEAEALARQAAAESDPVRKLELETRLFVATENHRRRMIRLAAEQAGAEKALAANGARAKEMLRDLRRRSGDRPGSGLTAGFDRELAEMGNRHSQELEQFRQLLDDKLAAELGYQDRAAALRDIAARQRLEKEKLMTDQHRRLELARLETSRSVAGGLAQLFADYYELSGKKSRQFFYLQKAAAMAEAIINTQVAAIKALAMQPPWVGMTMAGIIYAQGMARVALIAAQKLAAGGPVLGYSPTATADNIPVMATAGEYVQPVAAVRYYGAHVMEALRRRLIPRDFFAGLSLSIPDMPRTAPGFAAGGQVPAAATGGQPQRQPQPEIHITNIVDPNLLDQHLASAAGQRTILNVLSANRYRLRQMVLQE